MAKLTAPLLSFGASGQLGKTLVFFPWKGVKAVRTYVIPANPNTAGQDAQRGYMEAAVVLLRSAQLATPAFNAEDKAAYAAWAATMPTPRTWFNQYTANFMRQYSQGLHGAVIYAGTTTPGVDEIALHLDFLDDAPNAITAGTIFYGTSKTNLMYNMAATIAGHGITATLASLVTGTRYYMQFRATVHVDYVGVESGIYSDIAG